MFDNIGSKIKTLAVVVCVIGMIGSAIGAIAMWANGVFLGGLVILAVGCLTSWIGSFFTYGLGQLIENSDLQVEELNKLRMQVNELKQPAPEVRTPAPEVVESAPAAAVHEQPAQQPAVRERPAPKTSAYVKPVVYDGKNWICDKCGHENLGVQTFCRDCGKHRQ